MICKHCGRETSETTKCQYCGAPLDDVVSPENFYQNYKEHSGLEKSKKIISIIKLVAWIIGLIALVGFIGLIVLNADIIPTIFGFDVNNGTHAEMYAFINKLLILFALLFFIPLNIVCVVDILDWVSMKTFSKQVASKNINGLSLLTKSRLSTKNGKKEYIFISNSLCMIDEPSQKTVMGVKVIIKTVLTTAFTFVVVNFISYLTLTWMPSIDDPSAFPQMIYTDSGFWLNPNTLTFTIMFWANLIINSIMSIIVNRKYTRWVKNNNNVVTNKETKCDNEIYEGTTCPDCGHDNSSATSNDSATKDPVARSIENELTVRSTYPMKWYKAMLVFLWFGIIGDVISAFIYFTGTIYRGYSDKVYEAIPTLKFIDVISGIFCVGMVVFTFIVWLRLKKYKKHAPTLLIIMYVANTIFGIVYLIAFYSTISGAETTIFYGQSYIQGGYLYQEYLDLSKVSFSVSDVISVISSIVMTIVNAIYFKNRSSLFVN